MVRSRRNDLTPRAAAIALAALAALHVILALASLRGKTVAYDETAHIVAGYSYWLTGDFRLNAEHPPLTKLWAALPLLALKPEFPIGASNTAWLKGDQWSLGRDFLFRWNRAEPILWAVHAPMAFLGACLGLAAYAAAARHFLSRRAGLLAAALLLLEPNILAHSPLVTSDVPLALFILLAADLALRMLDQPTIRRFAALGLACSAAALTKITALPALATLLLLMLILSATRRQGAGSRWGRGGGLFMHFRRLTAILLAAIGLALFMWGALWVGYGLRYSMFSGPEAYIWTWGDMSRGGPRAITGVLSWAQQKHLLPEAYFSVFGLALQTATRPVWFCGKVFYAGTPMYFVTTAATKTPDGLLAILALSAAMIPRALASIRAAAGSLGRGAARERSFKAAFFACYGMLLFLLLSSARLNVGHRHALVVLPFAVLPAAWLWDRAWRRAAVRPRFAFAAIALWALVPAFLSFPDYIGYYNWLAGGHERGRAVALDSNIDWGQDLPAVGEWMRREGVGEVQLAYFGTADPAYYGIRCRWLISDMSWGAPLPPEEFSTQIPSVVSDHLYPFICMAYPAFRTQKETVRIGGGMAVYRADRAE